MVQHLAPLHRSRLVELIGHSTAVTSFFRDPEAFKALDRRLAERVKAKEAGAALHCWVVGCATGEEAFSIAILVSEALDRLKKPIPAQIYATDLDEHALAVARKGLYPKSGAKATWRSSPSPTAATASMRRSRRR